MSLKPRPADGVDRSEAGWSGARLSALPIRHPRFVRTAALVLGVGSVLLLPMARFDNNPLNVRDPSSESVRTFNDLLEKRRNLSLDAGRSGAGSRQPRKRSRSGVRALDVVDRVVTVADYIPSDQDEKLDIIGDVRLFMAPTPGPGGLPAPATVQEQIDELKQLADEIAGLVAAGAPPALAAPAQRLHESLGVFLAKLASGELPTSRRRRAWRRA